MLPDNSIQLVRLLSSGEASDAGKELWVVAEVGVGANDAVGVEAGGEDAESSLELVQHGDVERRHAPVVALLVAKHAAVSRAAGESAWLV
jgi:hypothetical protein